MLSIHSTTVENATVAVEVDQNVLFMGQPFGKPPRMMMLTATWKKLLMVIVTLLGPGILINPHIPSFWVVGLRLSRLCLICAWLGKWE